MSDTNIEVQDNLSQPAEETETEVTTTEAVSPHLERSNQLETLEERNKSLYARLKKTEEKLKLYETEKEKQKPSYSDIDVEELVNLRTDGYSREEVEVMKTFARGRNITLRDAATDPFIKRAIEANRVKVQSEKATPAPSSRPAQIGSAGTTKSWSEMTSKERAANFDKFVGGYRRGRSNE